MFYKFILAIALVLITVGSIAVHSQYKKQVKMTNEFMQMIQLEMTQDF